MSAAPGNGRATGQDQAGFDRFGPADVRDLIAEFPLAWVCARGGDGAPSSLLPLLGDYDADGGLIDLVGHLSRRSPLLPALTKEPQALVLVQGPQGYVSPEHAGRRDWAPTWNYAQLRIEAQVRFTPEDTEEAVRRLVEAMETGRARPWALEDMGPRSQAMMRQIVGFRARVTTVRGRFKLGQDETPETARAIIAALGGSDLARWMARFNAGRL